MAIYNSLKDLPELNNTVLTIGTFDGVHLGHQKLFEILNNKAITTNSESVVVTFNPHPQHVIGGGENQKKIITGNDFKIKLMTDIGIDKIVVLPFNGIAVFLKSSARINNTF